MRLIHHYRLAAFKRVLHFDNKVILQNIKLHKSRFLSRSFNHIAVALHCTHQTHEMQLHLYCSTAMLQLSSLIMARQTHFS